MKRLPSRPLLGLLVLLTWILTGCGQGPGKGDVKAILQDQVDPDAQVVIVERIDQLNVAEREEVWIADVEATLLFPRGLTEVARDMREADSGREALGKLGLVLRFGEFKAGETRSFQTRLKLIDGRKGWMRAPTE